MKIQCLMLKIHENPIRLQDPKTKFEMAGPFCSPWIGQMVRKPWRRKTVRAPFCGAPWAWGIYGAFFSFFFGDTPEFGWVKIMWNTSLEFSGHSILQCFFFLNAPVLEECVSCSSWNGSQEYEITGITSLWSHPQNGRFHLLSVWFFPMFLCLPSDRYGTSNHICSKDVFTLW